MVIVLAALPGAVSSVPAARAKPWLADSTSWVNPFVGTGPGVGSAGGNLDGNGSTFPGPVLPNGMIRMGPDTAPNVGSAGGYDYADDHIPGFSLDRMSGTGCPNYGDVPITPTTVPVTSSPVTDANAREVSPRYVSTFSHSQEWASPGYYGVILDQPSGATINVHLTTTLRTAAAQLAFPASNSSGVLVNAGGSAMGNQSAAVSIDPAKHEVTGSESSGWFCLTPGEYRMYFAIRFDRPFAAYGTWRRQSFSPRVTTSSDARPSSSPVAAYVGPRAQAGAYLRFDTTAPHTVGMRIGISFVSVAGALRNLAAESNGRSFRQIRAGAARTWRLALGQILVHGGSHATLGRFYTALYQALIEPATFSDVDGRYVGMDSAVHTAAGYTQMADLSGWDVWRSQMPLLAMLRPATASDVARSLVADAQQTGWLPKWPVANDQTDIMTGDPADNVLAEMQAFGARQFDARRALAAMVRGATVSGSSSNDGYVERPGLAPYLALGYVPYELNGNQITGEDGVLPWGSSGTTLEYALNDFSISQLARALGDIATCRSFLRRSRDWRKVFDPATGYVQPRSASGAFVVDYNPNYGDFLSDQGFAEGDAAQYTWLVPSDIRGLFAALGGTKVARRRLDVFFTELNAGYGTAYANLGDEPTLHTPWLYDWAGEPYKTQAVLRRAIELYPDTPGGFPGNDDLGTMSAWYVLASLGIYPEIPGTDVLALSSPMFPSITVRFAHGKLSIRAAHAGPGAPFTSGLKLDGRTYDRPWIRFSELARGATLRFRMSNRPDTAWGTALAASPPSFSSASKACTRH